MTTPQWTRDELRALARDNFVSAVDEVARVVLLPDWLTELAVEELELDAAGSVEVIHPDDRSRVIDLFLRASASPGELLTTEARANYQGEPHHIELSVLNLLHEPDLAAVLFITHRTGQMYVDDDAQTSAGEQDPTNWMLLTLEGSGTIATVQGNAKAMLGYEPEELIGRAPTQFLPAESMADSVLLWTELHNHPETSRISRRPWNRKDGEQVWIESSYVNRPDAPEGEGHVLVAMWDITERRASELALRQREAELQQMADDFRALADEVPSAVFRCDEAGLVTFHNARWSDLLDGRPDVARLHDLLQEQHHDELDSLLTTTADHGRRSLELGGNDETSTWRLTLRLLARTPGTSRSFIGSLDDMTATVRLRNEASHDPLTGLLNRAAIETAIRDALDIDPTSAIVAFLDLDRFKAVNDTYGHDVGDDVLAGVADRLVTATRASESVGRWGGDEFVVLFPDIAPEHSDLVAHRLSSALEQPIPCGNAVWEPAASIGIARPRAGESVEEVIRRADLAMLDAKQLRDPERPLRGGAI